MADEPEQLPKETSWPPPPITPKVQKTVLVQSKEMLGLLTNYSLLDFLLGLLLGPVTFFVVLAICGIVLQWFVPTLPVPKFVEWTDWGLASLGAVIIFGVFIRRYTYLMIGFVITASILAAMIGFFMYVWV